MTEAKAIVLLFVGFMALTCVAAIVLSMANAGGVVFGFVAVFLVGLGGFASSSVVMHYGKLEKRRKREEILLSR
jgi:uncharacterized membrane protein YdjX (TVP38/TMEM64 family)